MPEKGTTSDCTSTVEPPKSHMFKSSRGHHTKAELARFSYYVEVNKLYRNLQLPPLAALYYLTMVVFGFCKDSFSTSHIRKLNRTHHSRSAVFHLQYRMCIGQHTFSDDLCGLSFFAPLHAFPQQKLRCYPDIHVGFKVGR